MRVLCAALAACASVSLLPVQQATASADTLVISGSGTVSPGLAPVITRPQAITFTGTATVIGTDGILATYACQVTGTGLNDNMAAGVGYLSGSCGPISFSSCTFVRDHADTNVQCLDAARGRTLTGKFLFQPTDLNPVTRYQLTGVAAYLAA